MENLELYNKLREVPKEAQKEITGGNLNGMTDINPMWRIKMLTQTFGVCGIGWKYVITKQWMEACGNNVSCFCNIDLYIKVGNEWSEPIPGTGGSHFADTVKSGLRISDECYKMALTDALSVSMKALGMGADVYFMKDAKYETKYDNRDNNKPAAKKEAKPTPAPAPSPTPNFAPAPTPPPPAPAPVDAKPAEKTPLENLEEALGLVREDIANCQSHKELRVIFAKNGNLQNYQPFKDALNARLDEIKKGG